MYDRYIKRLLDISFSILASILLLPLIFLIIIIQFILYAIRNIFFIQKRPGKNIKIFSLYKFKTMDNNENIFSDEERTTKFGRLLRSTSFDELPQLLNILKGDMSIIGPRPLLVEYIEKYSDE